MNTDLEEINKNGFIIYKNVFEITPEILSELKEQSAKKSSPIFNSVKQDNKRIQCDKIRNTKKIKSLMNTLSNFVKNINPELVPSSFVLIESKPNCQKQMAHLDYENTSEFNECLNNNHIPLLVLIALENNTSLYVWENSIQIINKTFPSNKKSHATKINLQSGDIFVFRADVIHAGSDYKKSNIRMHCYLDDDELEREPNKTWIISKHGDEYIKNIIIE